jgi:predicted ATP-dependent protease
LKALENYSVDVELLNDICYVNNFSNLYEPRALIFSAGKSGEFKRALHGFIEDIKQIVSSHSKSDLFMKEKQEIEKARETEENSRLASFEEKVLDLGFRIVQAENGDQTVTDIVPVIEGNRLSFEELQGLVATGSFPQEEWTRLRELYYSLADEMKELFMDMRRGQSTALKQIQELRKKELLPVIKNRAQILHSLAGDEKTHSWIDSLYMDCLDNLYLFDRDQTVRQTSKRRKNGSGLARYGMNIVHESNGEAPILFENRPTLSNLVGTIDSAQEGGIPSCLDIRGGSILRANGGVLVIRVEDIVEDQEAWPYLKRVLQTGTLEIHGVAGPFGSGVSLKPESVEVKFKLVMIGGEQKL